MFEIEVTNNRASTKRGELLTKGQVGAQVQFTFNDHWTNMKKTAVFKRCGKTIDVMDSEWNGDIVTVPPEMTEEAGLLVHVGVYGVSDDDKRITPTLYAPLGAVALGAEPDGDPSTDPTLPVWAQLQAQIGDLSNLTTEDKTSLVAAINEAAKSGGGGVQSDWNQNDDTQPDYIKNRPFYNGTKTVTVETKEEVELNNFPVFAVGDTVTVNVDGVEYSLVAYDDDGCVTIGDTTDSIISGEGQLGWQIYIEDGEVWFYTKEAHTVSYSVEEVVKIDEKYLPPISKQVVYDSSNAVFKEGANVYYFVDPTTLTDILKSINTGSPMPYIGLKHINLSTQPAFIVNACINFGWGSSMNAIAVDVLGTNGKTEFHVYIFDTFQHAKEYYER